VAFHLAWAYLIYQLLKPVNRTVSAVAALMVITCCALQALTSVLYLAPLLILQGGQSLSGFSTAQAQALAFAFINVNGVAFQLDLVFFGLWCILTGYLIWRSALLPRLLGALLMLDGVGWSLYLWPPLATFLFPAIAVVAGLAEAPTQVWLIVRGVSNERWNELARRARMSDPGEDLGR
jgi:hypothetical protein